MNARARRKRAILRARRRCWSGSIALFGPLTGHDYYLIHQYYKVALGPRAFVMPSEAELLARLFPERH